MNIITECIGKFNGRNNRQTFERQRREMKYTTEFKTFDSSQTRAFLFFVVALLSLLSYILSRRTFVYHQQHEIGNSRKSELLSPETLEWFHMGNDSFWVYGCYWDHRTRTHELSPAVIGSPPYVRVLTVGPFEFRTTLEAARCEFHYENIGRKPEISSVLAVSSSLTDDIYVPHKHINSRPHYVYCRPAQISSTNLPRAVALIVPNYTDKGLHALDSTHHYRKWLVPIKGSASELPPTRNLMLCTKPMVDGPWNDLALLVQFYAYFDSMGVEHFIFYDAGASTPQVYYILNKGNNI